MVQDKLNCVIATFGNPMDTLNAFWGEEPWVNGAKTSVIFYRKKM